MSLPFVYHRDYVTPLPPEHRFPMPKFGKIYEILLNEGLATLDQFHAPDSASDEGLAQIHTVDYIDAFCERNYFSVDEMAEILEAGIAIGLRPKVHVNQFSAMIRCNIFLPSTNTSFACTPSLSSLRIFG